MVKIHANLITENSEEICVNLNANQMVLIENQIKFCYNAHRTPSVPNLKGKGSK